MLMSVQVEGIRPPAATGRSSPRNRIYPHRSVRSVPLTAARVIAGVVLALLLSSLNAYYAVPIMELHSIVAAKLVDLAGLPVTAWPPVDVFPGLQPGSAPMIEIPAFSQVSTGARIALIASIVMLLIAAARFSLFRNLAYFLIVLLALSAGRNLVFETFRLQSTMFGQVWLRQEMLVWLVMPWVLLLLFVLPHPRVAGGLGWVIFLYAYGFFYSAVRMVFILGVMHYTGLLFMPVLWFAFGTLSDLLYVLFFYSIAVNRVSGELWGTRSAWQSHF
ncbi:MAG: hypothetical protein FJW38_16725 [Acidobacteria bacterium]|nr:hypothetical protein [Acidobacteriota bacterium]